MIFYFSGTGNSKWVAEYLANKLDDSVTNIVDVKDESYTFTKGQRVGLVFPVYAWSAPYIVFEFARKIDVHGAFVCSICTCGSEAGKTMEKLSKAIPLNSAYSISMPSNYIIGMNAESEEGIQIKIANAKQRLDMICNDIDKCISKSDITEGSLALIKSCLVAPAFNKFARTTKPFKVTEGCNSCGLCEKVCLAKTIEIKDGKPMWGKECYQCLACINRCPQKAIEYGKSTVGKLRYYFKGG